MSLMKEYINKRVGGKSAQIELQKLIKKYNDYTGRYLFVFSTTLQKPIPQISLDQEDYYIIHDILKKKKQINDLDIYLETPGGSAETAEEIVRFLHNNFKNVSFIVSGEAKSAGTILVLSGNEIYMTETGSLGPIDAQMRIGRSRISAYDYMEWVENKRTEAAKLGSLNPFDATMIAQISPGELGNVYHGLKFAEDLVIEWLRDHKFRDWKTTETRKKKVTNEMKEDRAKEIAEKLLQHSEWRSHRRSIKIDDLKNNIKLKINRIEDDENLSDLIYRIQSVCRLLFDSTTAYKIYSTDDTKIFRKALPKSPINLQQIQPQKVDVINISQKCPKCGEEYKIYAKLTPDPNIDRDFKNKGCIPFPKNDKIICDKCGFEIDLTGVRNRIEMQVKRKIIKEGKNHGAKK